MQAPTEQQLDSKIDQKLGRNVTDTVQTVISDTIKPSAIKKISKIKNKNVAPTLGEKNRREVHQKKVMQLSAKLCALLTRRIW